MLFVPKDEKQDRDTSRKAEVEWSTREIIDLSNSWFYNQITISSSERCNPSGLWSIIQNDIFCDNY